MALICLLVLSRLEYANSLLAGCPCYLTDKQKRVQNSAAHLFSSQESTIMPNPMGSVYAQVDYKLAVKM